MTVRVHTYGYTQIGVAVSGGADSVFLLLALHELGVAAAVLHVNHALRGAESNADEAFVRSLAGNLGLPVDVLHCPVAPGNLEQEARRARYDFFARHIAKRTCEAVATGHTLDDQAETVLSRFLRGAGTAGLSGIRPASDARIIRPLLDLRRADIRRWLTERAIAWREDASNQSLAIQRNRIRLQHLPDLSASLNPALSEVLATTAVWAQDEEDYWSAELARLAPRYLIEKPEAILIRTRPFLELPVAVQRRLLRQAIHRVRGSLRAIDFRHVEHIRSMMAAREGSGRIQLPALDVYRSFDWLRFAPPGFDSRLARDFETPLSVPGRTKVIEREITIEMELIDLKGVYNSEMQGLDSAGLDWVCSAESSFHGLTLRNWRPGDQYRPQGRPAAEKIKSLFQEHRVPLWERRSWPVIVDGNNAIVWSRKFGAATQFAARPDSRKVLIIREPAESNPAAAASNH